MTRSPRLLLALGLLLTACTPDFDPYNRLTSLRVLAVRSQPVAPAPGETTTLDALVYLPDTGAVTADAPDPAVSYEWSWCPLVGGVDQGYPCLVTEAQVAAATGAPPPAFDLGTGATAMLPHTLDPKVLETACAGTTPGLPPAGRCDGGFPVMVRLKVSARGASVTAVRTVYLRYAPDQQPNENPSVSALGAELNGGVQPLDGNATLPRDTKTWLRVAIPPEDSESHPGHDDQGQTAMVRERLNLTWFVEGGDTRTMRTTFLDGQLTLEQASRNQWTPPLERDYARDTARVIVVIRDDRQGVGWTTGVARLGAKP